MKKATIVLLIAEFHGELSSQEVQAKLDQFREAALPNEHGISLYRATIRETQCFDLSSRGSPERCIQPQSVSRPY